MSEEMNVERGENVESGEKRGKKRGPEPGTKYNEVLQSLMFRQQQSIWTASSGHFTLVMHKKQERTPLCMRFSPKSSTISIKIMLSIKIMEIQWHTQLSLSRTDCNY
jgi:hypothetical protein